MSTSISILGNTGRDVELRYTPQGRAVANFTVASNSVRNTAQGKVKKTDWYNVSAFGKQAETLSKHLKKGSQILVRGRLSFNPWLSRDGEARVSADVVLQDFDFAGGAGNGNSASDTTEKVVSGAQTGAPEIGETDEMPSPEMIAAMRDMDGGEEPFAGQF